MLDKGVDALLEQLVNAYGVTKVDVLSGLVLALMEQPDGVVAHVRKYRAWAADQVVGQPAQVGP